MILCLIVLAVLVLKFRLDQTSKIEDGVHAIKQAYQRTNLMADINYKTRKLERMAWGTFSNPANTLAPWTTPEYILKGQVII